VSCYELLWNGMSPGRQQNRAWAFMKGAVLFGGKVSTLVNFSLRTSKVW